MSAIKNIFRINHTRKIFLLKVGVGVCITILVSSSGYYAYKYFSEEKTEVAVYQTPEEKDVYVRFVMEVYDSISKNYWAKVGDEDMAKLFQLSVQKATNQATLPELITNNREGVSKMISASASSISGTSSKRQMMVDIINVAMYNLEPVGRNGLYSEKQEVALRQNVSNINKEKDLYEDLGVEKGAPVEVVEKAYKEKEVVLAKSTNPEAIEELKKITYARKVLTDENNKKLYDESQIEPTISGKIFGSTLYLSISKISPTTLREFGTIIEKANATSQLDSMIIDLRGNIGGALDFLQVFLGAFIGDKQFAFDLFHQDEYQVQRTTIPKFEPLSRYKDMVILTDSMTQSTAELTAAVFKRMKLAIVVGETTRGWGTIENTYPIKTQMDEGEKFSLFLVNSLTLRDDNIPIEGRGVTPDIDIQKVSFKNELREMIRNGSLLKTVEERIKSAPLR
ncbi:hypothetical protein K9M47_04210 [Candidatus Gracilibacteria bacterium]|nr:hypothetical protein [Candidatus Gracilibacteria bacterium]MCF7898558.1 hypothetical protein [Candidatus Paceibacterota bacterium]